MELKEPLTIERMPDALVYLLSEVADIKEILRNGPNQTAHIKEIRLNGDRELADYLKCSVQTVSVLKKDGKLTFHRMGRRCYYLASEIDRDLQVSRRKFSNK
jgi:excisionase family DNA binding protein